MGTKLKAREPEIKVLGKFKGMFFGPTGCGKTWLALSFPRPYYWDAEGGAKQGHYQKRLKDVGGGYVGPRDGALEFETLIEQMDVLSTEKHEYQTLVIDSLSKITGTRIAKDEEALGAKAVFGAQKKPATAMLRRLIGRLDRIDMNVIFIAHEITEWGKDESGQRTELGRIPDTWEKIPHELDLTLRIQRPSPILRTATVYKTRIEGFKDGDRFDLMRSDKDVGYAEFATRYGKSSIERPVTPIVLATDEQVAEINKLLEIIKVDEKELDKIMTKTGVEAWSEMTTEDATKMVDWLKKKVTA